MKHTTTTPDPNLVPIALGLAVLLAFAAVLGGCTWGVLKDGDGNIKGVGPIAVGVEESPKSALDIVTDTLLTEEAALILGPTGLGGLILAGRAVKKGAEKRKQREIDERDRHYEMGRKETLEAVRETQG